MDQRVTRFWLVLVSLGVGAILGSGVANRWGADVATLMTSPNFATLLAGVVGAVVGGGISYVIARQTAKETVRREEKSHRQLEHSQALSCMVTTMQISNRLYTIQLALQKAANPPAGVMPWQMLLASAGQTNDVPTFDAKDFSPFINAGLADSVHRALLLGERVNSLETAYRDYGVLRGTFQEFLLPFSALAPDGAMITAIPPELQSIARYRMEILNKLIVQMIEYADKDMPDAKKLMADMNKTFKTYFGAAANFKLEIDEPKST